MRPIIVPVGHVECYKCHGVGRVMVERALELAVMGSSYPIMVPDYTSPSCPVCDGTGVLPLPRAHGADHD